MTRIFAIAIEDRRHTAAATPEGLIDLSAGAGAPSIDTLLHAGEFTAEILARLLAEARERVAPLSPDDVRLLAPLERPGKIVCIGRNYAAHARELASEIPTEPVLFSKTSSTLLAPGAPIELPPGVGRVDHEAELGVVIGRRARDLDEAHAMDAVAGYTVVNDVTARDLQNTFKERGLPWYLAKNFDTFCPLGPCIVLPDELPDTTNLSVELRVNGELRQRASTEQMLFPVARLIAWISTRLTLEPGDLLATGTPAGVGPLVDGDRVRAEVEGVGALENPVRTRS